MGTGSCQVVSRFIHAAAFVVCTSLFGMMSDDEHRGHGGHKPERSNVRDLVEFYRRWPEFRGDVAGLLTNDELTSAQRETLAWMVALLDRIGDHDLNFIERSKN